MNVLQSVWLGWDGAPVRVQAHPWEGWEMHPMWGMWGAWGFGMMLVLSIRWLTRQGRESHHDAALEILQQRYARGEINREEYVAKERDLKGGG